MPSDHEESSKQYVKRQYGYACATCKSRKIRCEENDVLPCKGCRTSGLICARPVTKIRREKKTSLVKIPDVSNPPDSSVGTADIQHRLRRIENALQLSSEAGSGDPEPREITISPVKEVMDPPRFQLGGSDHPVYYGETSMHNDMTGQCSTRISDPSPSIDQTSWPQQDIRIFTSLRHTYATSCQGEALMDAYFCWASVTYGVVNRSAFLNSMAMDGPMFSDLLLLVMYASGLRFSPVLTTAEREEESERYLHIIKGMIAEELDQPSSIPTAQALLALAGRQCAVGKQTQAWLYTGMAIRMIQDLGIHLAIDNPQLDDQFSTEMRHQRIRLYWSAYCWDKTISLGLGREPTLTCRPDVEPNVPIDEADDAGIWSPVYSGQSSLISPMIATYPRMKTNTSFILRYSAQLNVILDSILTNMYSPQRPYARSISFIHTTNEKLERWRENLPLELRLDRDHLPHYCPPTHVTTMNLLFFTIKILIYRPLLVVTNDTLIAAAALEASRSAAANIHEILACWIKTFGSINFVYLMMYSTFISAGVDVTLMRLGDNDIREEASKRVNLSLSILELAAYQGPGIRRGIVIIHEQLRALHLPTTPSFQCSTTQQPESTLITNKPEQTSSTRRDKEGTHGFPEVIPSGYTPFEFTTLFDEQSGHFDTMNIFGGMDFGTDDPFTFLNTEVWADPPDPEPGL